MAQVKKPAYNPYAYVPGGSSPLKSSVIQSQGYSTMGTTPPLRGYNPNAYVPGGAAPNVAQAIQKQGYATGSPAAPAIPTQPVNTSPGAPAAPPGTTPIKYDLNNDPILRDILALGEKDISQAQGFADENIRALLLGFGSTELAKQLLPGGDEAFLKSVGENPFGVLQRIKRDYETGVYNTEEDLNKGNLFYGGHRINRILPQLMTGRQQAESDAEQMLRGQIRTQQNNLANILSSVAYRNIGARGDAASRLYSGIMSGQIPGSTNGGVGGAASSPPGTTVTPAGNVVPTTPTAQPPPGMTPEQQAAWFRAKKDMRLFQEGF